ncbi:uncharacterized protein LOC110695429, partial [Chenopodium quinoa]|uniref:uncharacterized protein LOC110695429 n=1 Tax=Chenopodium quinoa TaxID=63459 RepID=UPI000B7806B4
MLSLLITGPRQPGHDIDVFLKPLVDDLRKMWDEGVSVYDAHKNEMFLMRAALMWTINDFPAYGNLSGYKNKGHKACPVCIDDTPNVYLEHYGKDVYVRTRRFLRRDHPYRRQKKAFNGKVEEGVAPRPMSGHEVYGRVKGIPTVFEKNVCDAVVGTIMGIHGKTKDGKSARLDLEAWGVRPELWVQPKEGKAMVMEKVREDGGNKRKGERKGKGIGVSKKKDEKVKVLDPFTLDALQANVVVTLCKFEMYFPPSFFDIMVHLVLHLVREIKMCGPVFMRWCYPFERHMGTLQHKVRNPAHPEGSMIQGIVAEEIGNFVAEYVAVAEPIGLPTSRHEGRLDGHGTLGSKRISPTHDQFLQAHLFVLHHVAEVHPYLEEHMDSLRAEFPSKGERGLMQLHNKMKMFILFEGYDINGYTFWTEHRDQKSSSTQNSGVTLVASSTEFASAKDTSPVDAQLSYYGRIQEIWELDYREFKLCDRYENNEVRNGRSSVFAILCVHKMGRDEDIHHAEVMDDEDHGSSQSGDELYDVNKEQDLGEPEDQAHDELRRRFDAYEMSAECAPPIVDDIVSEFVQDSNGRMEKQRQLKTSSTQKASGKRK